MHWEALPPESAQTTVPSGLGTRSLLGCGSRKAVSCASSPGPAPTAPRLGVRARFYVSALLQTPFPGQLGVRKPLPAL